MIKQWNKMNTAQKAATGYAVYQGAKAFKNADSKTRVGVSAMFLAKILKPSTIWKVLVIWIILLIGLSA